MADFLLVAHFLFVLFVVIPVPLILIGAFRCWRWIRLLWFRRLHLASIVTVLLFSVGSGCPLTIWESRLRQFSGERGYEVGFIAYWLHRLIYFNFPGWVFILAYSIFGVLIAVLYRCIPPETHRHIPKL